MEQSSSTSPTTNAASTRAQDLVERVQYVIKRKLRSEELDLQAMSMMTREVISIQEGHPDKYHYIKVKTTHQDWPWLLLKIFEPSRILS